MANEKCNCGHAVNEHDDGFLGCLAKIDHLGNMCECRISKVKILEARIYSLETDLIHARRVADERQEIIDGLKLVETDFKWLLSMVECMDLIDLGVYQADKVREMLVKYVG